jgi:hypothetical protein
MSFEVRPELLKAFAHALDRVDAAAGQAVGYCAHTRPDASGGSAFVRLLNSTAEVQPTAERFFEHLARISGASADELVQVARHYERTDHDAAERADRLHRTVQDAPSGTRSGPR